MEARFPRLRKGGWVTTSESFGGKVKEPTGGSAEVGIHGGVGGAVSWDDDVIGEPDGETGEDDGVGCVGQVIFIYPYGPLNG